MRNSIYHSETIYKFLLKLNVYRDFSHTVTKHIMAIIIAVFCAGYKGKTVQFCQASPCHRTTIAHFLNEGKWDSGHLEDILKKKCA